MIRQVLASAAALTGILFVLRSGTSGALLPREMGCGIESGQPLDRRRGIVEQSPAWFAQFRSLAVRYERRADIHPAVTPLAAALIVWRFIERWFC